jgi:membrane protein YdbS with pleckstrin-like domain
MRPEHEWFKPEQLTAYYFLYEAAAAIFVLAGAAALAALGVFDGVDAWILALVAAPVVAVFAFLTWWIPAFYRTAAYRFTDDEIEYRRGVFFQQKTTVPYNRITNVKAYQGPIQRFVGAGSVGLHTAGYGGQAGAELTISAVGDYEDVREQVLAKVRRRPAEATESGEASAVSDGRTRMNGEADEVVAELRRIRELLEDRPA